MGIPVRQDSPTPEMPSASTNGVPQVEVNGSSDSAPVSANDNIRRFAAPSRTLSPMQHALFHPKTRCFV